MLIGTAILLLLSLTPEQCLAKGHRRERRQLQTTTRIATTTTSRAASTTTRSSLTVSSLTSSTTGTNSVSSTFTISLLSSSTTFDIDISTSLSSAPSSSTTSIPETTTSSSPTTSDRPLNQLPTTVPDVVYTGNTPASYDGCLGNPTDSSFTFSILDPNDGIPIVNVDGLARKATEVMESIPQFRFQAVSPVQNGLYDLVLDGKYLAATLDGNVIFTDTSSGPTYITEDDKTFITSLFSYTCDGLLNIGIPGIVPYDFGFIGEELFAQPRLSEYNPASNGRSSHRKRQILNDEMRAFVARARVRESLRQTPFLPAPPKTYRLMPGDDSGERCPASKFPSGVFSSVRPDARAPVTNGCGSTGISRLVPNLDFGSCCNRHDLCYDDCQTGFDKCNTDFGDCNRQQCYNKYSPGLIQWGCVNMADFYEHSVTGKDAREAFGTATSERCQCTCSGTQGECNGRCMSFVEDPLNCGSCGNVCDSGECVNYRCMPKTVVAPPASNDVCNEANYLWFNQAEAFADGRPGIYTNTTVNQQSTKAECCRRCQSAPNCLAYQWWNGSAGKECKVFQQVGDPKPPLLTTANPTQCPLGGTHLNLNSAYGDGTEELSGEPGPCNVRGSEYYWD